MSSTVTSDEELFRIQLGSVIATYGSRRRGRELPAYRIVTRIVGETDLAGFEQGLAGVLSPS